MRACACGELCKALPRDECGEPLDGELGPLGCRFLGYIGNRQWRNALETFHTTEERMSVSILAPIVLALIWTHYLAYALGRVFGQMAEIKKEKGAE